MVCLNTSQIQKYYSLICDYVNSGVLQLEQCTNIFGLNSEAEFFYYFILFLGGLEILIIINNVKFLLIVTNNAIIDSYRYVLFPSL